VQPGYEIEMSREELGVGGDADFEDDEQETFSVDED
jgi:hypothetical protein